MTERIDEKDLPLVSAAPTDDLRAVRNGKSVRVPIGSLPPSAEVQAQLDALASGQAAGQLVYRTWAELSGVTGSAGVGAQVIDDTGTHTDPVVGGTVANAGQYVWSASPAGWRWVRADALPLKADQSELEVVEGQVDSLSVQLAGLAEAADGLRSQEFVGLQTEPTAGAASGALGYTFILPSPVENSGVIDRIELFAGSVSGTVKVTVFSASGTTLTATDRAATFAVNDGVLNVQELALPVNAGEYIGLYSAQAVLSYSSSGIPTERRAYRVNGDATSVDLASAPQLAEIHARARVRYPGYDAQDIADAVEAGNLTVGALDRYSVAMRRPLLLDISGVHGVPNSLYVPRDIWFTTGAVNARVATNSVVHAIPGGYCRIGLSVSTFDTGAINTVYFDPADNTYKVISGLTLPSGRTLTKLVPIFQFSGRNGGWRAADGLNVQVLSAPVGAAVLRDLMDAIRSPLRDCKIALVGDSITWGMTADGNGPTTPRNWQLTDTRDVFTSGSWANRLRRWASMLACGSENESSPTEGATAYSKEIQFAPWWDDNFIPVAADGRYVTRSENSNSAARLRRYLDTAVGSRLVFEYTGGDITFVHAAWAGSVYEFYVDGELVETYSAAPELPATFGVETTVEADFGKHRVEVLVGGSQVFRLEAIKRTKVFSLHNNGIIGTNTRQWLPSGSLLSGGVPSDTTHVFIQLGTNDRLMASTTSEPAGANGTYQNLIEIIAWLRTNRPLAQIILMAPPYFPTAGTYASADDEARAIRRVAVRTGVGFIDNFSPTMELEIAGETWLADGLHPNNLGHRRIFQNIQGALLMEA